jgi:hypothetical protein
MSPQTIASEALPLTTVKPSPTFESEIGEQDPKVFHIIKPKSHTLQDMTIREDLYETIIRLLLNNERLQLNAPSLKTILETVGEVMIEIDQLTTRDRERNGRCSATVIKNTLEIVSKVLINGLNLDKYCPNIRELLSDLGL